MRLFGMTILFFMVFVLVFADTPSNSPLQIRVAEKSQQIVPGLTYGKSSDVALPKTILFSASPDEIIADAEEWARRGISAFFMDYIAREWSTDIWGCDGKPWTIGESDDFFKKARQANDVCRRIGSETFLKIAFDNYFEWFNDIAWQHIEHNFRQFAIFARETGCTGIALDIEYCGDQYRFEWEGYDYSQYTRTELAHKVHERMTRVIQVLYDEFPDMVFLTFPEQSFSLGMVIHKAWLEEAARRNAPGGFHYCTEGTYRRPSINYMFAHGWLVNSIFERILSRRAISYWRKQGSIAAGVWPFGFDYQNVMDPGMTLEQFRQAYAASLMMSPRYNWIYSHNSRELLIGRALKDYQGDADIPAYLKVIADRHVVLDAPYAEAAKRLRSNTPGDLSEILGLVPTPQIAAPTDYVRVESLPQNQGIRDADLLRTLWHAGVATMTGQQVELRAKLQPQTEWLVIGPFPSDNEWAGHNAVYPPEAELDLDGTYKGVDGPVRWQPYKRQDPFLSVNLKEVFSPHERVTAYALCYVHADKPVKGQIRLATNDMGKAWLGGNLIYEYPYEGNAFLDRDVIDVTFPAGSTPLLIKITNGLGNWAFICRFTDEKGTPLTSVRAGLVP